MNKNQTINTLWCTIFTSLAVAAAFGIAKGNTVHWLTLIGSAALALMYLNDGEEGESLASLIKERLLFRRSGKRQNSTGKYDC